MRAPILIPISGIDRGNWRPDACRADLNGRAARIVWAGRSAASGRQGPVES